LPHALASHMRAQPCVIVRIENAWLNYLHRCHKRRQL
jgi:hypothetical protein